MKTLPAVDLRKPLPRESDSRAETTS